MWGHCLGCGKPVDDESHCADCADDKGVNYALKLEVKVYMLQKENRRLKDELATMKKDMVEGLDRLERQLKKAMDA